MAAPYPLADMIELVAPRLHASLVSRDNIDRIVELSRDVPHWQCAGFECRLGDAAPRADFGIHVRRRDGLAGPDTSGSPDARHRLGSSRASGPPHARCCPWRSRRCPSNTTSAIRTPRA